MNELFPIIRRKRRPLLPVEAVPDLPPAMPVVGNAVKPVTTTPTKIPVTKEPSAPPNEETATPSDV